MLITIFSSSGEPLRSAPHFREQRLPIGVQQHDAAAIGLHPLENQIEDPLEQLVDVERVADRQRDPVHHLQIALRPGQPRALRKVRFQIEELAPLLLGDRPDNVRLVAGQMGRGDVDLFRQILGSVPRRAGIEHQGASQLHLVAAC